MAKFLERNPKGGIHHFCVGVDSVDATRADLAILARRLPASERLQFWAGQYIDILLKDGRKRSFSLANEIDESKSEAKFDNGVLTLKLPKKAATTTKRLAIQ